MQWVEWYLVLLCDALVYAVALYKCLLGYLFKIVMWVSFLACKALVNSSAYLSTT